MCLLFFIVFFFFSCSSEGDLSDNVVARVNNKTLTKEDLVPLLGGKLGGPKTLMHATNRWVENTLFYDAAIKAGLKKDKALINQKESFYKNLLVSSYINIKTKNKRAPLKEEVATYYKKNKKGFTRKDDVVVVKEFVSKTKKEAGFIKKALKRKGLNKKTEDIIKKNNPKTVFLDRALLKDSHVGFVFKGSVGDVFGPKKHENLYYVFEIIKKHKKGSVRGLELVYDEIHQRLYKQKEMKIVSAVLDSLYTNSDVFISPAVFIK